MEFQNLQSLLNRATAPASEEEAKHYCTRFTTLVNQEPDGASRAITLLIAKVQSQNEPVALRAIHVMDKCAKNCGKPFQMQIGKFRFLNELIKLVSPKYMGKQTPVAVRSAIVQQLKLWSTTYKDQTKILDAFNMLEKTGNTKIKTVDTEFSYAAGEDADKAALLAQLLKSKNKQDLETANQMIKDMVAAEGRKIELDAELLRDVSLIHNNGRLLAEMLANSNRTSDEVTLLEELHKECVGLRPKLYRLAGQLSDSAQLSSVVEAGETLNRAIEQYEQQKSGAPSEITPYQPPDIGAEQQQQQPLPDTESTTLINLEDVDQVAGTASDTMTADDFDDFLSVVTGGGGGASSSSPGVIATPSITTASLLTTNGTSAETGTSGLFGGMTLAQPQDATPSQPIAPLLDPVIPPAPAAPAQNDDFADALGLLSFTSPPTAAPATSTNTSLLDDLFSAPATSQENMLPPLLGGDILQPSIQPISQQPEPAVAKPTAGDTFDLLMPELAGASFSTPAPKPTLSQLSTMTPPTPRIASPPIAPVRDVLQDVEVPLTLIRPASVPPVLIFDSGAVRAMLYKTENRPEPSVNVFLITITNSSTAPIDDVEMNMKTDCGNLKLATASSKHISPFSPICPYPPIQQVLVTTSDVSAINYTLNYKYNSQPESKCGTLTL